MYKLKNIVKKGLFTLNVVNKNYLATPCVTNFHGIMLLESIFYFSIKIFKLRTDVQLMLVQKNIIILILWNQYPTGVKNKISTNILLTQLYFYYVIAVKVKKNVDEKQRNDKITKNNLAGGTVWLFLIHHTKVMYDKAAYTHRKYLNFRLNI